MVETCFYREGKDCETEVEFMGIFQHSRVVGASPFIGGSPGGTISNPVAVIKMHGKLLSVDIKHVRFESRDV